MYAAVVEVKPEFGKKEIITSLMNGLTESHPVVVPHVWHAVLITVTSVPVSVIAI